MQSLAKVNLQDAELSLPKGMVDLNKASMLLFEQMEKVKNDPAAIPQAEAMGEIAGRLIDIAKVQVSQGELVVKMVEQQTIKNFGK